MYIRYVDYVKPRFQYRIVNQEHGLITSVNVGVDEDMLHTRAAIGCVEIEFVCRVVFTTRVCDFHEVNTETIRVVFPDLVI